MTFITIIEYVFSPYPVYPECILGVSCWDPNFGLIELFFMVNMGFFGVGKSFLTFIGTSEYVFYLYSVYSVCILGVSCLDPNFGPIELSFTILSRDNLYFWIFTDRIHTQRYL